MVLTIAERMEHGTRRGVLGLVLALLFLFVSCGEPQPPQEFGEAFVALDKAFMKEHLEASAFAPRFPNPTAKQVISYILSQAGAEVLQISNSPLGEDVDVLSDVPVWPSAITLWHTDRLPYGKRRQVILTWNEANTVIHGEAFVAENPDPLYIREWHVPALAPKNPIDPSDTREFQAF